MPRPPKDLRALLADQSKRMTALSRQVYQQQYYLRTRGSVTPIKTRLTQRMTELNALRKRVHRIAKMHVMAKGKRNCFVKLTGNEYKKLLKILAQSDGRNGGN